MAVYSADARGRKGDGDFMSAEHMNPQGEIVPDNESVLSFQEIDKNVMMRLRDLPDTMPKGLLIEQTQLIILGAIKEMLRTLARIHPEEPKIMLPGGRA